MIVKMVLIPLFIVGNVILSCAYATGSKIFYDLSSACGYTVESDRPLSSHLHDCSMLYEDPVNSPFFYGGIVSFKARDLSFTQLESEICGRAINLVKARLLRCRPGHTAADPCQASLFIPEKQQ